MQSALGASYVHSAPTYSVHTVRLMRWILFAFALAVCPQASSQQAGPTAVSSNGVTIAFQNSGGDTTASKGVTISFQTSGGDAVSSNGATISFQNAGNVGSGSSG